MWSITLIYGPLSPADCFLLLVALWYCTCCCFSPSKKHLDRFSAKKTMNKGSDRGLTTGVLHVIAADCFITFSWRKCWKWSCARCSMSLTSARSTAFSLQTDRTFLQRDRLLRIFLIKEIQALKVWIYINTCSIPERVLFMSRVKFLCMSIDLRYLEMVCLWIQQAADYQLYHRLYRSTVTQSCKYEMLTLPSRPQTCVWVV